MMNIDKLFRIWIPKIRFTITILEELIFITPNLCHLNLRLRSQFCYPLLGVPPLTMEAKYPLSIFRDHPIKVSRLTRNPLMDSRITDNLIQGNLEAHKDNPSRDNLRPLMVHLLPILGSLLVIRDNHTHNKANLLSNKATLLGKSVSLTFSKANPLSSLVNHLDKLVSLTSN